MWRLTGWWRRGEIRWFSSSVLRRLDDEGDWFYSPEWWGGVDAQGHTVFRSVSQQGNGIVSVTTYPSSRPAVEHWPPVEHWLQERYTMIHPEHKNTEKFKILGYQWRVLRFNDDTRQSTVKIMAAYRAADPSSLYLMQQPQCLAGSEIYLHYDVDVQARAVDTDSGDRSGGDLKSMVSVGLTWVSSSGFNLQTAVIGETTMKILCIGHGGGSLPLFLAKKIKGAIVHIVEIDPVVISASVEAMGFPSATIEKSVASSVMLWGDIHKQLCLCRSDAENFVANVCDLYDLIFIDAYDGDDIFPRKLWDPQGPFLESLQTRLHPVHGTVVVNLHADCDAFAPGVAGLYFDGGLLPMGKYVREVCRAYRAHLGFAYVFPVPWLCNLTLVASTGVALVRDRPLALRNGDLVPDVLMSKANMVEELLDLPFSCLQYVKRGFMVVN